jgi:hypothetical protein
MPGLFGKGKSVGLGFFFRMMACFLIGMALLKVDSKQSVKSYERKPWSRNSYVTSRMPTMQESYRVSFIFDLFVRASEEIEGFASTVVDQRFAKTNSQLATPSAFYKDVMFAWSHCLHRKLLRKSIATIGTSQKRRSH